MKIQQCNPIIHTLQAKSFFLLSGILPPSQPQTQKVLLQSGASSLQYPKAAYFLLSSSGDVVERSDRTFPHDIDAKVSLLVLGRRPFLSGPHSRTHLVIQIDRFPKSPPLQPWHPLI